MYVCFCVNSFFKLQVSSSSRQCSSLAPASPKMEHPRTGLVPCTGLTCRTVTWRWWLMWPAGKTAATCASSAPTAKYGTGGLIAYSPNRQATRSSLATYPPTTPKPPPPRGGGGGGGVTEIILNISSSGIISKKNKKKFVPR
jgi:hypothetical protein